jgi:hypothetical protein
MTKEEEIKQKLELIKDVSKNEYEIRRKEFVDIDKKTFQLLSFAIILFGLFIQFIEIPTKCIFILFYFLASVSLVVSIFLMVFSLWPKTFPRTKIEFDEKRIFTDDLKLLIGQCEDNVKELNLIIDSKLKNLVYSSCLILFSLLLTLIIKIGG